MSGKKRKCKYGRRIKGKCPRKKRGARTKPRSRRAPERPFPPELMELLERSPAVVSQLPGNRVSVQMDAFSTPRVFQL